MNKHHPHNDIIEKKLEQLPAADTEALWNNMHLILDKKMPQKKERRRFVAWFLISKPFLLLTAGFIIGIGSSLFFLSPDKSSTSTISGLPESSAPAKIDKDDARGKMQPGNETISLASESNRKTQDEASIPNAAGNVMSHRINNRFTRFETKNQPGNFLSNQPLISPAEQKSSTRPEFNISTISLKSNYRELLAGGQAGKKNSLHLQPVPAKLKMKNGNKNESGFYIGITSGIDLSSINFRSAKTGANKGFIIGYSINRKWSIESGLLWDTKRVYDNGRFFNPPGYTATSGMTITAVNGKSRLYELPLNMKYTIKPGRHNVFATAGLSSYLMRSENYDYEYMQNNQPGGHNYLTYKNETKNWFSVVNFSIGYAHRLTAIGNIRIEPYLKFPINELGTGKMPIRSMGLNVGLTRTLK